MQIDKNKDLEVMDVIFTFDNDKAKMWTPTLIIFNKILDNRKE